MPGGEHCPGDTALKPRESRLSSLFRLRTGNRLLLLVLDIFSSPRWHCCVDTSPDTRYPFIMVGWGKILSVFHHRHLHPHPLGFLPPLPDAEGGSGGRDGEEWETEQEGGETEEEEMKGPLQPTHCTFIFVLNRIHMNILTVWKQASNAIIHRSVESV